MLSISFSDFITLLAGVRVQVTADGVSTPQCVDPIQLWARVIGAPRFTGNAEDIYDQPGDHFEQIPNEPNNYPTEGAIIVFNSVFNGTVGHVALVESADVWTVTVWEQNDPLSSDFHRKIYPYANGAGEIIVKGWLQPKK